MDEVVVNGTRYVPAGAVEVAPRIGVAITTRNRHDVLARALDAWRQYLPAGAVMFVVDDASDKPVDGADYRFDERAGIAAAKNKSIELLMDADVEHLFLFDDDAWPKVADWWRPYVEGPEPHYAHSWDLVEHYRDEHVVSTHAVGGTVLYLERRVVDEVGGMDPAFGKYGREHVNLSDRIFARGLTTFRYQDVPAATDGELFYELDRHERGKVQSTATQDDLRWDQGEGRQQWIDRRHETVFVPYRAPRRVVLTDLYTKVKDPQRGTVTGLGAHSAAKLLDSLDAPAVVFTDLDAPPERDGVEWVPSRAAIRTDFQRWVNVVAWLRDHPDVDWVWHVDATDVTMTQPPWEHMRPGVLYVGCEQSTLQSPWLLRSHPDATLQGFFAANPTLQLLNAGLVGGDRATVLDFARRMVRMFCDDQIDKVQRWETGELGTDMGAFNYVAYTHFADRLFTGPAVCNVFRSGRPGEHSWWAHK
ncbi:glycosyltransferase family 2 protein [Puerhibacterium puerhi]|uniref:glycosyltransferase family 2 protein n=1 Tax=Puerhibacterium puerhi TaxID=2692623 RepID=UPI00135B5339|nr:glycosyltransferase family 2 protein [Puerhibacterium puerhi]